MREPPKLAFHVVFVQALHHEIEVDQVGCVPEKPVGAILIDHLEVIMVQHFNVFVA